MIHRNIYICSYLPNGLASSGLAASLQASGRSTGAATSSAEPFGAEPRDARAASSDAVVDTLQNDSAQTGARATSSEAVVDTLPNDDAQTGAAAFLQAAGGRTGSGKSWAESCGAEATDVKATPTDVVVDANPRGITQPSPTTPLEFSQKRARPMPDGTQEERPQDEADWHVCFYSYISI